VVGIWMRKWSNWRRRFRLNEGLEGCSGVQSCCVLKESMRDKAVFMNDYAYI